MRMLTLNRDDQNEKRTLGTMAEGNEVICQTLELPWLDNQHQVSCVPTGTYQCKLLYSPKHDKDLYWLMAVPGRGAVEIHVGNTTADTLGCILLGAARDGDTIRHSQAAFATFMTRMEEDKEFTLIVQDEGSAQ